MFRLPNIQHVCEVFLQEQPLPEMAVEVFMFAEAEDLPRDPLQSKPMFSSM
jgi:hypothetical protein